VTILRITECRGRVVNTSASYSGCPRFKSGPFYFGGIGISDAEEENLVMAQESLNCSGMKRYSHLKTRRN
jgi:hypothetical protein